MSLTGTRPQTVQPGTDRQTWDRKPAGTVKIFAWIGAGAMLMCVYTLSNWIISGRAGRVPPGDTPLPSWMKIGLRTWEGVMIVGALAVIWVAVIRPWRRDGRLSWDGVFALALFQLAWTDPFPNLTQVHFVYNSYFFNFGSWNTSLPGWLAPNANYMPQPIFGIGIFYLLLFFVAAAGCAVMRRAKERWPNLSKGGVFLVCLVFFAVFDLAIEPLLLRGTAMVSYPGALHWLTLWQGHYYQYPVYEAVSAGIWFGAFASIRYFRNDKGESVAERGLHDLKISERKKTGVRFLALVGLLNVIVAVLYVPWQFLGLHSDSWPADITNRSYLTGGGQICGPGTTYACPGPDVPNARRGSNHMTPSGGIDKPN